MAESIDRLTTVFDARFDRLEEKLNKAVRATYGAASKIEKRWDVANDNIGKKFGKGLGATFAQEVNTLASSAGRAQTALSGFGVAGTAAAAGIAAVVAAFAGARNAARFADEIADTAKRLHVTTDALQEYQYAIRAAGGEEAGAAEALESFSEKLGDAQRGLPKAIKAFEQLGFKKEQIKSMTDADAALKAVAERIEGLPTTQQDAIIKALGLEGLKPLLQDGVAELERLRAEAHKVGVVMDANLIKRGAELNDQFETVARVIDIQLKSALVDLGPILVGLLKLMAELARAAADVADAFRSLENKSVEGLKRQRDERLRQANSPLARAIPALRTQALKEAGTFEAEIKRREATATPAPKVTPTRSLIDTSKSGGGRAKREPRDSTVQRTAQVEAALLDAERDLLQAWSALAVNADARADIANLILDVDREDLANRTKKQVADIEADDGLSKAKKLELTAGLKLAELEQDKVFQLRRELIERERVERKAQEALDVRDNELNLQEEGLRIAESLARTAKERRDIELRLLDLADQREKAEQEAILASKTSTDAEKKIAQAKLNQLEATRGGREEQVRQNTQGPLESYFDKLPGTVDEVNESFERLYADGINSFIDGTAEAIAGMRSFKSVVVQTIQQMAVEANRVLLQSLFANIGGQGSGGGLFGSLLKIGASAFGGYSGGGGPFAIIGADGGFIPYASGTDSARRGWALVGENGPEFVRMRGGEQVIPNDILRSMAQARASGGSYDNRVSMPIYVTAAPGMTAADARRTGHQIGAAAQRQLALSKRRGY